MSLDRLGLKIEARREIPRCLLYATPVLAVALTGLAGFCLFLAMGYDPLLALYHFFVSPLLSLYGWSELMVKAAPLIMIGVGLAVGFRANVRNRSEEHKSELQSLMRISYAAICLKKTRDKSIILKNTI